MSLEPQLRLARLHPAQITVSEPLLKPTWWDTRAVLPDLIDYVSLTRIVPGTPSLAMVDDALVLVSGLPFLRAAQEAHPPLEEIVCRFDASLDTYRKLGIEEVKVGDLLDVDAPGDVREELQIVCLKDSVDVSRRQAIEQAIKEFVDEMLKTPSLGGKYRSLRSFEWNETGTRLIWRWERSHEEGPHQRLLVAVLRNISSSIANLRSWNGLTFDL